MDDFQFVFESPQAAQNHKKRPRLVTSCDNCRLKKIKCLQASPDSKCEACSQAKVSCRFNDRERYFVERSRVMAGPGSRSDIQSQSIRKLEQHPGSSHLRHLHPSLIAVINLFLRILFAFQEGLLIETRNHNQRRRLRPLACRMIYHLSISVHLPPT